MFLLCLRRSTNEKTVKIIESNLYIFWFIHEQTMFWVVEILFLKTSTEFVLRFSIYDVSVVYNNDDDSPTMMNSKLHIP